MTTAELGRRKRRLADIKHHDPNTEAIRLATEKLRVLAVNPLYPSQRNSHCCKGFRIEAKHSAYCYTRKGYYVGVIA